MYGQGIPRVVNLLCEHALLAAHAEKRNVITSDMIGRVATTFELTSQHALPTEQEVLPRFGRLGPIPTDKKTTLIVSDITVLAEQQIERAPLVAIKVQEKTPEIRPKPHPNLMAQEPVLNAAAAAGATAIVRTPETQLASSPIIARTAPSLLEQEVTPQPDPSWMAQEPILRAAAATGATATVRTPETQVASSPIIARTAPSLLEREVTPEPDPSLMAQEPILHTAAATGATATVRTSESQVTSSPIIVRKAPTLPDQMASQQVASKRCRPPGLGTRLVYYLRAVEQSFVRDWNQFLQTYAQAKKASGRDSPGE